MSKSWILDYATPTTLSITSAVAPTGYIREALVIRKGTESSIVTLTSKQTINPSKAVNGLFDAGMSRVGFKEQDDLDLSLLSLNGNYFTIVVEGFSEVEISAKDLGDFNGVFVFESSDLTPSSIYNTWEIYSLTLDSYTAGYNVGRLLVPSTFVNLQYTTTNKNVFYVEDKGTADGIYQSKGTIYGKDDFQGIRLVSAFINGEGVSKPYILEEIKVLTQSKNITMLSKNKKYTKLDAQLIESFNATFIKDNYVTTGLIESFEYSVKLGTVPTEFNSFLDVKVPLPVWKINMEITA